MSAKLFLSLIFILALGTGCSQYPLSGNIKMGDSDKHPMLYLIEPLSFNALVSSFEGKVIDSASIDQSGNFKFEKMRKKVKKREER